MEVAPGIHRIKCRFGDSRMVYVHLLVGDNAAMLVDTGCAHNPEQEILPAMREIGLDPKRLTYILISHSDLDHQGGNQLAHERPGFTLRDAIDLLGPGLGGWPAATNQDFSYAMLGHLNRLTQRGVLTAGRDAGGHITWSLAR